MKIGVALICKNEEKDLPKMLASIPFADVLAILDTGSTDSTLQIARDWSENTGKRSIVKTWFGASEKNEDGIWVMADFAKARNKCLELLEPHCDYVFVLDADDAVENPESVRPLVEQHYGKVLGCRVLMGESAWVQQRIWPCGKGVKYYGACHEYPWGPGLDLVDVHIRIRHTWGIEPNQEPSGDRNIRILSRIEDPSARELFYLANSLRDKGLYTEAVKKYEKYLQKPVEYADERIYGYLYLMRTYRKMGELKSVLSAGFSCLAECTRFSEIWMELCETFVDLGEYPKGYAMALSAMQEKPATRLFLEPDKYDLHPQRMASLCLDKMQNRNQK